MSAVQLLIYVSVALSLQLICGVVVGIWQRRRLAVGSPAIVADNTVIADSGAWVGWREFRVARRVFEDLGQTQCSFYLEPVDRLPLAPFKPGQYLTFSLEVADTGATAPDVKRTITRCYSLSAAPDPTGYRVTVKRVAPPNGRHELPPGVSSGHFHDAVHQNDILKVKAPAGKFFIDPDPAVPVVLVAGGIGITPMMSMLGWYQAEQPQRTVHLYYGLRKGDDHAFKQPLAALAAMNPLFHLNVVYSNAAPDDVLGRDYQYAGHVDVDLLRHTLPHGRHRFYVCGPPAMMASLVPALGAWGVSAEDIRHEAFGPASMQAADAASVEPAPAGATSTQIRFRRTARTLAWDGRDANLLDFAERHGVEVESGCRSGSCGSCQTRLVSGTVRYLHQPDYDVTPGCCLLCVGLPEGALELEA